MDQKTQILTNSELLFRRYGIKSVTMDDIARHQGISKKTLYLYVDSKTDLIDKITQNHISREVEEMAEIRNKSKDAIDEILNIAKYGIQQLRNLSPTVVYDLKKYYRESWSKFETLHKTFIYTLIKENIDQGRKEGFYREGINPDIIAKLYVGKTMIVVDEELFPLKDYNREQLFKEYMLYHIHGIASDKGLALLEKHMNERQQTKLDY